ncbi:hypothetical protein CFC21_014980 [Triticum aestivum]|uniref:Dirigent protein n=2 Tax=Triticum aestivum TaxID=4565 RepID=A0A9R1DVD3_WHEAT|nr:hypothetical protein CFC21_014980 [Triticum aestivum]
MAANPSNFKITRYFGPPYAENAKLDFNHLYLHQIFSGPNPNQEQIVAGNPTTRFGKTEVNNWPIYDGVGPNAKLVARAQGTHVNVSGWYTSFTMVFVVERFKGSTLQITGTTIEKDSEWAIVGRTGEFVMARGVIARKVQSIQDGERHELTIDAICRMKNQPIHTTLGPWGTQGTNKHDIQDKPARLYSVEIRYGSLIDAISFSYIDQSGQFRTAGRWGGGGGKETKIQLGPGEVVKEVSGTVDGGFVSSLKLVTDIRTYGPFGEKRGTSFSAPVPLNGHVVGFFGSSGAKRDLVNSIGVYTVS